MVIYYIESGSLHLTMYILVLLLPKLCYKEYGLVVRHMQHLLL